MKKVLHIIATPRSDDSRTLKVSNALLEELASEQYQIEELNLYETGLPELSAKKVDGKYALLSGKDLSDEHKKEWEQIVEYIDQFKSADAYLLSTPMWNFGIPYVLKHYIDIIFQPRYLFQYGPNGVEGLVQGKKMIVVSSRGGDYSENSPAHAMDFLEPYLKNAFGFVGLKDITFINAQPMDAGGKELRVSKLSEAIAQAKQIAKEL